MVTLAVPLSLPQISARCFGRRNIAPGARTRPAKSGSRRRTVRSYSAASSMADSKVGTDRGASG